ncbi:MAG TPA: hypothetical protein VFK76_05365 [Gaiellaceae bacterium]|nr:hypothetical protein [Gaiellaceae bacterium]
MRRYRTLLAIAACFVAGVVLVLLGLDAASWRSTMRSDDVTYRAAPQGDLWSPRTFLPARITRSLLGIEDDIAYRRALQSFRLAHVERPVISDPSLVVYRNDATVRLTDIVEHGSDPLRRSDAANLLGAIAYSDALGDFTNRAKLIVAASQRFGQSITFDPSNDDAKYNLELTLALGKATGLSESGGGANPAPGGKGSKGAGAGDAGSGF